MRFSFKSMMEYDNIVVKHVSLFSRTRVGNVTETCWIWIPDIDRWYPPLLLWTLKHPHIISAIRHQRIAPSWFGFYSHVSCLSMHLVAARCTGHKKIPQQPSPSLSFQTLVTHNKETHSSISLSGAIHHVMKSFFLELFGRHCRDKVPVEQPSGSLHSACGLVELGYRSEKQNNNYGCVFSPSFSFSSSPRLTLSLFIIPSFARSLQFFNCWKSSWATKTAGQIQASGWIPWWLLAAMGWGRGACQHLHWVVPIWYSHSEGNRRDGDMRRAVFLRKGIQGNHPASPAESVGRLLRNTVMTLWFICEADGPCYWMGLSPSLNVSIIYMC